MKPVTFRVPEELKREMDRLEINWSDYLRQSVREALDRENKRRIHQKLQIEGDRRSVSEGTSEELIRAIRDRG